MPEPVEEKSFSAHEIGEKETKPKKKKIAPRKKKNVSDESTGWGDDLEAAKKKKIDAELTAIYEDKGGKIPDMKKIKIKKSRPAARFFGGLLVVGVLIAAVAWGASFILPGKKFSETRLEFKISGPNDLALGATTTYVIAYKNDQDIALKNSVLTINYPEGFAFLSSTRPAQNAGHTEWTIGDMPARSSGEIEITGQAFGAMDQEFSWRAFLNYQPENFQSELQKIATLRTKIAQSPIELTAGGPDKNTVGDDAEYVFVLKNSGEWQPDKLELRPILPTNFYAASSSPKLDKNNKWILAKPFTPVTSTTSTAPRELTFKIDGKFNDAGGLAADTAEIKSELWLPATDGRPDYKIGDKSVKTELTKNDQTFNLAVNGSLTDLSSHAGDFLNITIYLKNSSKESMKKNSFKLTLDAPAVKKQSILNWPEIEDKLDGDIVGSQLNGTTRRGVITWDSGQLPDLAEVKPGQEISIDLRLPIREAADFDMSSLTDFQINILAEETYRDKNNKEKTLTSNPIAVTVNSDLKFESRQETTTSGDKEERDLTWVLTNNFHPLKNLELSATIFGDVSFTSASPTPAGVVNFDPDTQKISWTIQEMPLETDVLALPFSVVINKKNPTQNLLISKVHVRALDSITGQTLDFMGDETAL